MVVGGIVLVNVGVFPDVSARWSKLGWGCGNGVDGWVCIIACIYLSSLEHLLQP